MESVMRELNSRQRNVKQECEWLVLLLCWAIERFEASEKQTALIIKASELREEIEKFYVPEYKD
jgi:hypothetical protein